MMHCVLMSHLFLVTVAGTTEANCPHTVGFDPTALKSHLVLLNYEPMVLLNYEICWSFFFFFQGFEEKKYSSS